MFFQEVATKGLLGVGPGRKASTVNYAEAAPPALPSLQPRAIAWLVVVALLRSAPSFRLQNFRGNGSGEGGSDPVASLVPKAPEGPTVRVCWPGKVGS